MKVRRMQKGMMEMAAMSVAIERVIATSSKTPSKAEASKVLQSCGIFDHKNNVTPAYKAILVHNDASKKDNK